MFVFKLIYQKDFLLVVGLNVVNHYQDFGNQLNMTDSLIIVNIHTCKMAHPPLPPPPVKVYKRKEKQPKEITAPEGDPEPNPSRTLLDQVPSQAPSQNEKT